MRLEQTLTRPSTGHAFQTVQSVRPASLHAFRSRVLQRTMIHKQPLSSVLPHFVLYNPSVSKLFSL